MKDLEVLKQIDRTKEAKDLLTRFVDGSIEVNLSEKSSYKIEEITDSINALTKVVSFLVDEVRRMN